MVMIMMMVVVRLVLGSLRSGRTLWLPQGTYRNRNCGRRFAIRHPVTARNGFLCLFQRDSAHSAELVALAILVTTNVARHSLRTCDAVPGLILCSIFGVHLCRQTLHRLHRRGNSIWTRLLTLHLRRDPPIKIL